MCDGAESWSHDSMGRGLTDLRTTSGVTKSIPYTYNLDGSLAALTYRQDHYPMPISYTPGGAGRPISAGNSSFGLAYSVHYAPNGSLCSLYSAWGLVFVHNYTFNNRFQPTAIQDMYIYDVSPPAPCSTTTAPTTRDNFNLSYSYTDASGHNNGDVQRINNNLDMERTQLFTYDSLNRLATAETLHQNQPWWQGDPPLLNCWGEQFNYDAWGNLTGISPVSSAYTGCTQENWSMFATAKNQLQDTNGDYVYDAAGNLINPGPTGTYTYDAENHLISAGGLAYLYDGDGKRVGKAPAGTPTQPNYLYWYGTGSQILEETDGAGNYWYLDYYFNGMLLARGEDDWVDHFFADALGNTRCVYGDNDPDGGCSDYYPFGGERPIASSNNGVNVPFKFTGKERDAESGLDNFGKRYLGSSLGRFQTPDPVLVSWRRMVNPQLWNAYAFVGNNPLRFVDPTGEELVQLGQHTDDEIRQRKKEIGEELKNKDLTKDQKGALKKERNTLGLEQQGNHVVAGLLADLDKTGERNGLQLSNFTLSTNTKNDFAGHTTSEGMEKLLGAQAFVLDKSTGFGGTIFIRTEPETGFYRMSQSNSDFGYYGASALSHEQVHLNGGPNSGEYPAFQRQLSVFEGFQSFFQNPALYRGLDESIRDGIKANQPH